MVVAHKPKLTYEDYRKTPEGARYELLNGELIELTAPRIAHRRLLGSLYTHVNAFVRENGQGEVFLSPTDVVLTDSDTVQPDLIFVSVERADIITPENIQGPPDLVVEILSPSTASRDWTDKLRLYAERGVREYWLTSVEVAQERVWVLTLAENERYVVAGVYDTEDTLTSPILPGFALDLSEVFEQTNKDEDIRE